MHDRTTSLEGFNVSTQSILYSFSPAERVSTDQFIPSNHTDSSPYRAGKLQNLVTDFMEVTNN